MSKNLKTILNSIGIAIVALLIVNLMFFGFDVLLNGIGESWSVGFKHGVFYLDGEPSGLLFRSAMANGLMFLVFILAMFRNYRKGNLSF